MTDEIIATHIKNWTTAGENELLKIIRTKANKELAKVKKEEQKTEEVEEPTMTLHEMLYEIFDEFTNLVTAKNFWKKLVAVTGDPMMLGGISSALGSIALDVLVVQEGEALEVGNTERHIFLRQLVQSGLKDSLIKNVDVIWRFSLASAATITGVSEASLSAQYRISFSRNFFTLPEYNLLREESQGYSKLITYLLTANLDDGSSQYAQNINDMIGSFALHPTRVLDIVLTSAAHHLDRFFDRPLPSRTYDSYERALGPIRDYLSQAPRHHLYSLVSYHFKRRTTAKQATTLKTEDSKQEQPPKEEKTDEIVPDAIPLSTFRILAMLIRFGLVSLQPIMDIVSPPKPTPPTDNKEASATEPESSEKMDTDSPTPTIEQQDPVKTQLFCALLEIPDDSPLGFLSDQSTLGHLGVSLFDPQMFTSKRVAAVFSQRLSSHFAPIFEALSPANRLHSQSSSTKSMLMPTMTQMAESFMEARPLLIAIGEAISARLHHIVCVICTSLVDGILVSQNTDSESVSKPRSHQLNASGKEGLEHLVPFNVDDVSTSTLAALFSGIEEVLTRVLLPSFVCLEINANTMWKLLHLFPYSVRYRMYHTWSQMMNNAKYPRLTSVGTNSRLKVRGMLKRVTDQSIKETGRPLCKWANKFPTILASLVGSLVFPNFVQPLADSMRYLSDVSLDVLIFSCLQAIVELPAGNHLLNVSTFISCVFKTYYERLDIIPLLDVIEQLLKKTSLTGSTLFTTLLSKMGCVDIMEETLSSQISMLHSFPSLSQLAITGALQVKESSRSSVVPLRDRLWKSNSWLPLYILVLQLESYCSFHLEENYTSKISGSLDTVHQLRLQLAEFSAVMFRKYHTEVNPSLLKSAGTIAQEFDVPFSGILHLYRPILHLIYTDVAQLVGTTNPMLSYPISNTTADATDPSASSMHLSNSMDRMLFLSDDLDFSRNRNIKSVISFPLDEKLQAALDSCMPPPDPEAEYYIHKTDLSPIENLFPLGKKLLAAFWGLRLVDVSCDPKLYNEAILKQTQLQQQGSVAKAIAHISPSVLEKDLSAHSEHVAGVFDRLKQHCASDDWFVNLSLEMPVDGNNQHVKEALDALDEETKKRMVATTFLQHCIIPRALNSPEDALYCSEFIILLHKLNPSPLWDTYVVLDCLFAQAPLIFSSTSTNECSRFGRFVCSILEVIVAWRDFDAWCANQGNREFAAPQQDTPQDASQMQTDESKTSENAGEEGEDEFKGSPLRAAHRDFCIRSITWEMELLNHVMDGIVKPVDQWMRRVILFFLKETSSAFPTNERFCSLLAHALKKRTSSDDDLNLKALTNSYRNLLEARAKSTMPHHKFQALFPGFVFPDPPPAIEKLPTVIYTAPTTQSTDTTSRPETPAALAAPKPNATARTPSPSNSTSNQVEKEENKPREGSAHHNGDDRPLRDRDARDNRDNRDNRDTRDVRDARDTRDMRDGGRDGGRDSRRDGPKDFRDYPRDFRDRQDRGRYGDRDRDRRDREHYGDRDGDRDRDRGRDMDRYQSRGNTPKPMGDRPPPSQDDHHHQQGSAASKKRARADSPEPPAPVAEKRQKVGENTSQTRPIASTPPTSNYDHPPPASSSRSHNDRRDDGPIGPMLPPAHSARGRRYPRKY